MTVSSSLPAFSAYSDDDAVTFYLGRDADLARCDAEFVVDGRVLPVHSDVLTTQSRMFEEVLADGQRGAAARLARGGHLLDHATRLEVVMSDCHVLAREEQSLAGYTLKRVAQFLRFAYHPQEVATLDLSLPGAARALSAAARLAHRLDMPGLLEALDARMDEAVGAHAATLQRLVDWCCVAEECNLPRLQARCLHGLAVTLARSPAGGLTVRSTSGQDLSKMSKQRPALRKVPSNATLPPDADPAEAAVHDVALLQALSPKAQLAVMAALLAALRAATASDGPADSDLATLLPAEDSLGAALPALS